MAAVPPPEDDQEGDEPWAPGFEKPCEPGEERKEEKKEGGGGGEGEGEGTKGEDIEPGSGDTDKKPPPKKAETIRGTPTVTQPGLDLAERTEQETTAEIFAQWEKAEMMMRADLDAGTYTKEQIEEIRTLMAASKLKMGLSGKKAADVMTIEQLKEKIINLEKDLKEKGQHGDEIIAQLMELQDQMKQTQLVRAEGEKREARYKEQYKEAMAKVDAATKEQRERKERTDKKREEEIRQAEARILADALRDREIAVNLLQRELTAKEEELDRMKATTEEVKELLEVEAAMRKEAEMKMEGEIAELQKQASQKDKKVEELIQELKTLHERDDTVVLLQQQLDAKQKELDRFEAERRKEKELLDKEAEQRRESEIRTEAEITKLQREAFQKDEKVKELTKELGTLHEKDDTITLLQQQLEAKQKELDRVEAERKDGKEPSDKGAETRREEGLKWEAEITELQRVAYQKDEKIKELAHKLEVALLTKYTEGALYHTGESYVDAVKRLERDNLEFRRQIAELEKVQGQLESKNAELEVSAIKDLDERINLELRAADGDAALEKMKVWQEEEEIQIIRMNGLLVERRNLALQVTRQEDQVIEKDKQIQSLTVTVEQLQAVVDAGPEGAGADNLLLRKQLEEFGTEVAELKQQLEGSKQEAIKQESAFTIKHTKLVDEYESLKKRLEVISRQKEDAIVETFKNKEMEGFERKKYDWVQGRLTQAREEVAKTFQKQIEELQLQEAKTKRELEAVKEDREAIKNELVIAEQNRRQLDELKKENTALKSQMQELQRGLAVVRLRGRFQKCKEELAEAKKSIEDLKQQLTAKEQQPGGDIGAKENEISRLKQGTEKLESEIQRLKQIEEKGPQDDTELSNLRHEVAQLKEQEENWKTESNLLIVDMQQSVDVINELSTEQQRLNGVIVVLRGKLAESVTAYEAAKNAWRLLEAKVLASAKTGGAGSASQTQQAQAKRIQQLIDENKKLREELTTPDTGTGPGTGDLANFNKRKAQSRLQNIQMLMSFMVLQRASHGFVAGDMDSVLAAVDQATIEASLVGDQRLIVEVAFWATIAEYYLGNSTGALVGFEALKDSEQWTDKERELVKKWIAECEQGSDCPKEKLGYKEAIAIEPVSDAPSRPPRRPSDKARREAKKAKKAEKKAAKKAKKAQQKSKRASASKLIPRRELYVGILSEDQQKIWDTIDFEDFNYEKLTTQQQSLFSFEPIKYEPDSPPPLSPPPAPPTEEIPFYKLPALPPSRPGSETSDGRPPEGETEEDQPSRMGNVTANAALHIQFLTARLADREARIQELENMHVDMLTIRAQLDERDAQIQELRRHSQVMIAELTIWRRLGLEQEEQGEAWWARIRI
ncbi:hypothetical protein sscle_08g065490 [Sclerotinia sclerotiorum 1980 UF-70]|uniref:Uncharacterized protein n=1 Tax=Sclerotinia sclerotiorum (strain ATCC 18683 / 1980 / Ss-1) TaxID=665079 RepID=A0A1D9QA62_SCLS1|nr:hypothetical protein sscle_08g065490 [Sclerotinia sclerotiorum 1980 UF-70]